MSGHGDYRFFVLPLVGGVLVFLVWWKYSRAKHLLHSWAEQNGFEILHAERRILRTGPFQWWRTSREQIIYFVRVRDGNGRERSAWVRCGGFLGGVLLSNQTEVKWDEP